MFHISEASGCNSGWLIHVHWWTPIKLAHARVSTCVSYLEWPDDRVTWWPARRVAPLASRNTDVVCCSWNTEAGETESLSRHVSFLRDRSRRTPSPSPCCRYTRSTLDCSTPGTTAAPVWLFHANFDNIYISSTGQLWTPCNDPDWQKTSMQSV